MGEGSPSQTGVALRVSVTIQQPASLGTEWSYSFAIRNGRS